MYNLKKDKFFYIRFLSSLLLSIAVLFSFRYTLLYNKNLSILIIFLIFQFIIWAVLFLSNKKINIIFINLFFIIFLNLILTPQFYKITFDIPVRNANNKQIIEYKRNFFKGIFSGIHTINTDEKGYRTNKKINYKKKPNNTIRVVTIGASSTDEYNTDDKKTRKSIAGMVELYHHPAQWTNRQYPRIYNTFVDLWGTEKLWVSLDRVNINLPNRKLWKFEGFLHWDIDISQTPLACNIQGVLSLSDTVSGMGGLQIVPELFLQMEEWLYRQFLHCS